MRHQGQSKRSLSFDYMTNTQDICDWNLEFVKLRFCVRCDCWCVGVVVVVVVVFGFDECFFCSCSADVLSV